MQSNRFRLYQITRMNADCGGAQVSDHKACSGNFKIFCYFQRHTGLMKLFLWGEFEDFRLHRQNC